MGWTVLRALYPQAVEIAKQMTGKINESEAVAEFKVHLNSSELYLNEHQFPANESDEGAFQKCRASDGE